MRAKTLLLSTAAILPAAFAATPLAAQSYTLDPPPVNQPLDENGVDLSSGAIVVPSSTVAIGESDGLVHSRTRVGNGWRHNYILSVTKANFAPGVYTFSVQIGGSTREFVRYSNGDFNPLSGELGSMSETASELIYTDRSGTEYRFSKTLVANGESYYEEVEAVGTEITRPNNAKTELTYRSDSYLLGGATIHTIRLQSVTNNASYQLKFSYEDNTPDPADQGDGWYNITKVTAINNAEEYCDPAADSCSLTGAWPYLDYAVTTSGTEQLETVTDILGRQSRFRNDSSERLIGVKRPSETTDGVVVAYDANSRVSSVTHQGSYTRNYSWSTLGTGLVSTANDALGRQRTVVADINLGVVTHVTDALGNQTEYKYDTQGRVIEVIAPEGNKTVLTRDDRGRVTEVRQMAKPGSGLADIVTSATYPALTSSPPQQPTNIYCTIDVTCDSPLTTTDARGKVTNYTYNNGHGGVLAVELPADSAGIRPKSTFGYQNTFAKVKNASGTLVTQSDQIVKPRWVKRCRVGASCAGGSNEQVVELTYNNTQALNGQPYYVRRRSGDYTLIRDTYFSYTELGQVETTDGPLPGTVDVSKNRYDDAGQLVGTISPDPDGASGNPHVATRLTYNDDGQVTIREQGNVAGLTDADWNSFAKRTRSLTEYDEFGRVKMTSHIAPTSWTAYSLTQYSYDNAGRLECTAQRMNAPSALTTLPADACTLMTAGAHGEDRIAKRHYDTADRITEVWSGVGTSLAQQSGEMSYTDNGQVEWVEDAMNNRTEYTQDGFDRNIRITYPDPTTPGTANTNDYEAITYDDAGNILTHRTRRNETFNYTYDNLGRVTHKDVPTRSGLAATHTRDVYYGYDLLGGLTYANFDSASGEGLSFTYDALGQLVSATTNLDSQSRTLSYQYDGLGRRTRITHPDGKYWTNEWDNLSRLLRIRDQANIQLTANVYWGDGRLRRIQRESSAPYVDYLYDGGKRLDEIVTNHSNNTYDVTQSWTLNPAGQVADESINNNIFASHALLTSDLDYTANGLNQYTNIDGFTQNYDANGSLSISRQSDGLGGTIATTYVYDTENRLVSASGGKNATLRYDPFGRLYEVVGGGNTTRFHYDGDALVGEYNASGTLLQRYIHGPSAGDDPLIRYPGTDALYTNAHYLYADRLGSITQETNRSGTQTALNTYDAYGVPGASTGINNTGRFRYTGQAWIEELGMYYYKARMYSPTLGRFMQTDPIGYADGMNLYRYVGNDPINYVDPWGLNECESDDEECDDNIVVSGTRLPPPSTGGTYVGGTGGFGDYDGDAITVLGDPIIPPRLPFPTLPPIKITPINFDLENAEIVVKACRGLQWVQDRANNIADFTFYGAAPALLLGPKASLGSLKVSVVANDVGAYSQIAQDFITGDPNGFPRALVNLGPGKVLNRLKPISDGLNSAEQLAGLGGAEAMQRILTSADQYQNFVDPPDQCN